MGYLLTLLLTNPASVISIGLAIVSISLAIFFYLKGQRRREPCWSIRNEALIKGFSSRFEGLSISYKEHNVENLSISKIVFWNSGRVTIDGRDIADANKLRFVSRNGVDILDASVIASTLPANQFEVSQINDSEAELSFDYLDESHGGVIQIIHTGTSSDNIKLEGNIKGVKLIRKVKMYIPNYLPFPTPASFDENISTQTKRRISALVLLMFGVLPFMISVILILSLVNPSIQEALSAPPNPFSTIFLSIIGILMFLFSAYTSVQRWRSHVPLGLESFEED
jgi:hypothetical protein